MTPSVVNPNIDFAAPVRALYSVSMSYQVFARKYRPQTFEEIVAQEHVTRTLQNAVRNNRVASAYLFCGQRGTGKTTTARVLAKAINCVEGPTPNPCGKCSNCKEIAAGSSLDVLEIDAASNTGVDDVRTLRENVRYLPTGGKKRIYIIDEVHRLSKPAFDALLKTLEEPPPHVIFMFATTEPWNVPDTILSRTQRFDMKRVSTSELMAHVRKVAKAESLEIDDPALMTLCRKADGSVRDALSLLDQLAAFAQGAIDEKIVIQTLGLVDRGTQFDYVETLHRQDRHQALSIVQDVLKSGTDAADFVTELLEHLRILVLLASDTPAREMADFTAEEMKRYRQQAGQFSVGDLLRFIKVALELHGDLRGGLDEQLLLEVAAVKMAEMESTVALGEVLQKLRSGLPPAAAAGSAAPAENEKKKPSDSGHTIATPARRAGPSGTRPTPPTSLETAQARWPEFLAALRNENAMLASQLSTAHLHRLDGHRLTAVFAGSGMVAHQVVTKQANRDLIGDVLKQQYGPAMTITFEIDTSRPVTPPAEAHGPAEANHILARSERLRRLVEKVDGVVIGVKKTEK